jgi:hypothetical protein
MPLIFSTMTGSVTYTDWKLSPGGLSIAGQQVTIKGGANVADRKTIITPRGVGTQVSDKELAFLENDPTFKMHKQNGFITIDSVADIRDADLAASDMEGRDDSAPDTPNDFIAEGAEPPTTTTVEIETPAPQGQPASRRTRK